ncbi:Type I Iterative PKS [Diaporthe australafricana]|uniref:Type I Iterative PKS n=1 Tax=Diaporthe australafricana TaxID=127596 RepID=A0ABR3WP50_9PEZI
MVRKIDTQEDIAVIGLGLKFPGDASTPEAFYDLLLEGRSALQETPKSRYNIDAFYHPDHERFGAVNVRHAHYLKEDIAAFDAPFFSITPNEAVFLDPQQRGLLETVYHALENAGVPMSTAVGSNTSVHMGCFTNDYSTVLTRDPDADLTYSATGVSACLLSNRMSWFYDFKGPSLTLDTACSSSLNAVHLGSASLRSGEVNMAVVGGCNLFYNPDTTLPLSNLGFLSPDGKCHSFDSRANGYSRGEGFGVVILKRVSDAIRDGNTIRAVIRGSSSNQDGKSPGITQPTRAGQEDLIRTAYRRAGLALDQTRFFEAHGTGTPIGDPIEAGAIGDVFSPFRAAEDPMYVGALKSNLGHLEGAAGVAGLIKAIHVVESGVIPPNLHFEEINPKVLAGPWKLKFPLQPTAWPVSGLRRASVNSFGFGGSNAHVILDDAYHYLADRGLAGIHNTTIDPKPKSLTINLNGNGFTDGNGHTNGNGLHPNGNGHSNGNGHQNGHGNLNGNGSHVTTLPKQRIFPLSAYDQGGVERLAKSLRDYLDRRIPNIKEKEKYLTDLSHTLASKRTNFPWRATVKAESLEQLKEVLSTAPTALRTGSDNGRLALVFTGQGAQWAGMGRELIAAYPVFSKSLEDADAYLKSLGSSWSVFDVLDDAKLINKAEYSQPICTVLQVALVALLRSWSVQPGAVVGHSSGEIAAAHAAGALSREDAWRIAYYRGLLTPKLALTGTGDDAGMGMVSVALDPETALEHIRAVDGDNGNLAIACFNSPKNVTISGSSVSIAALQERLGDSVFNRKLRVENAYHSKFMQPIAEEYGQLIGEIEKHPSGVLDSEDVPPLFYSSLTGDRLPVHELQTAGYWVGNLAVSSLLTDRSPKSAKSNIQLSLDRVTEIIELGPHPALQGPLREIMDNIPSSKDTSYVPFLRRNTEAIGTALLTAGFLSTRGQPIDVDAVNRNTDSDQASPRMLVDLPPYPFNHTKTYWKESRLSKGYRFRKAPRHELLGAPVPDWSKKNAIWRNYIRLNENPWIKDHRITGSLLYPGAGMLVMAIEAMRQLANTQKVLRGFRFKEVVFQVALRVPTGTDGIETHLHVRPYFDSTSSTSSNWSEFQLSSIDGDEWRDHCRGLVQADYEVPLNPIDNGLEQQLFLETTAEAIADGEKSCRARVAPIQLYELLHTVGFDFGETFQTLTNVSLDADKRSAIATVTAPDIASKMPLGHVQPHLIHPTTLDGVLQSAIVALTRGGRDTADAMVPTSIKELWIAADSEASHETLRVVANAETLGLRQATATATGIDPATNKPLITIDGFVSTAISGGDAQSSSEDAAHHHLCFNTAWKPDIDLLTQDGAVRLFVPPAELTVFDPTEVIADTERLCYLYLKRYMKTHDESKIDASKPWYQIYLNWMRHQIDNFAQGKLTHAVTANENWDELAEDDAYFHALEAKLANSTPEAIMTVAVGKVLAECLHGKIDPLEVFFKDALMDKVYSHGTGAELGYSYVVTYIDHIAHKNSDITILEVGAGTGGATVPMLEALCRHGEGEGAPRFERYDFTDLSPAFFEKAEKKFAKTADRMVFKTLNIENDPIEQGFKADTYDVIIAANVIHATTNIDHTLTNCFKMLKPGGKLILNELTNPDAIRTGFGFGLLYGWWLSEEPHRQWGPLMSPAQWDIHLKRVGFSGVDLEFTDYTGKADHLNGVLVATKLDNDAKNATRSLPETLIVFNEESQLQKDVMSEILKTLPAVQALPLQSLPGTKFTDKLVIFLGELDRPLLDRLDEATFSALQQMTTNLDSLLWLTQGGGAAPQNPDSEMVTGFARVIRQENPTLRFITLAIDEIRSAAAAANTVLNTVDSVLGKKARSGKTADNSFWESEGVMHIPRLVEASEMNNAVARKTTVQTAHPGRFGDEQALKLVVGSPGLLDTLQFIDDARYDTPLQDGEVEFRVAAAGLNFLDVMIALGQVIGENLGCEGAGVVTRVGPNTGRFAVGDRVCGLAPGTFNTFARTRQTSLVKVPSNLSMTGAAGFTVVYVTAYAALVDIANIQPGETVLIHAAAGGVGQACIQLAQVRGAEIFATVGSVEKRDLLMSKYGIPQDHILSSRDLTFARGIKRLTKGRGVDVAVNSLSGDALRATWEYMAPFGRFVEVGKIDIYSSARLNMAVFKNNVSFEFVDISFINANDPPRFANIIESLMTLVEAGKIGPLEPTQEFAFGKMQESFRYMQSGAHSGKIVLVPGEDDEVPIVPSQKESYEFDPSVSFVIAGGLGGLGRSMARWMAKRGARNLILLSRSGNTSETSRELVSDLESLSVKVATPACDVSDLPALQKALEECNMPPVKGSIQGSMVLKDSTFAKMTLQDWNIPLRPKVAGSWNLHRALPEDLDFFILLSSIATIWGNRGQSNYSAGNSFQDALARHRTLNGQAAAVLDLGMILSVGYVAENEADLVTHLRKMGAEGMREEELHAILNELCAPPPSDTGDNHTSLSVSSSLVKSQISLGLQLPETRAVAGEEYCDWMSDPLVRHLHQIRTQSGAVETEAQTANYAVLLAAAEGLEGAAEIVFEGLKLKLVKALNISADEVDPNKPLHGIGVDSLVAVELRTWILRQFNADVAVFDLMEVASIRLLAVMIATRSGFFNHTDASKGEDSTQ